MDEIRVTVVDYGRTNLMLRYIDPITGKQKHKSAETANMAEALKAAGKWQDELRDGRYAAPSRLLWPEFRQRYEDEAMPSFAVRTAESRDAVMNHVETILSPKRLADLTAERLSYFQSKLREKGQREPTILGHLAHLRAILSWAANMGLLRAVPKIKMPSRNVGGKLMRGRPISGEEFDRMLAKATGTVMIRVGGKDKRKDQPISLAGGEWPRYLWGLWLSGLRLEESLRLTWDDGALTVDLGGKYPRFRIYAEAEKGHKDRLLPMTPDFAEWLLQTPEDERTGFVFPMGGQRSRSYVGRIVSAIGKAAGVVVNREQGKFASAHDLRRSFGTRWASKVKPATLQLLMRHSSIDTTLMYYVAQHADDVAAELWAGAAGPSKRDIRPMRTNAAAQTTVSPQV